MNLFAPTSVNSITAPSTAEIVPFPAPNGAHAPLGLNGASAAPPPAASPPRANDPLAGMTPWQIYQRCIWVSDEDANTKISLLCISRYMNKDLRASSMSYAQIARDCGFSEPTAKRCAKAVANTWLKIGVGKGRYVPGKGHENLYHGVIPQQWADEVRRRMLNGIEVNPDEAIVRAADDAMSSKSGVSHRHPEPSGVSHRHPEKPISGYQADTGVSERSERGITQTHLLQIPPEEESSTLADASAPAGSSEEADRSPLPLTGGSPPTKRGGGGKQSKKAPPLEALEAFNLYIEVAQRHGLPTPKPTHELLWPLASVLKKFDGLDGWRRALAKVEALPALRGLGDGWSMKVSLFWLTKDGGENLNKVLSGECDDWGKPKQSRTTRPSDVRF